MMALLYTEYSRVDHFQLFHLQFVLNFKGRPSLEILKNLNYEIDVCLEKYYDFCT